MSSFHSRAAAAILLTSRTAQAATFRIDSTDAIKETASFLAQDLISYYHGTEPGQIPGILPGPPPAGPYYWWEAGAMWGAYIDYWHLTGDDTYNDIVKQALLFQTGPNADYMPPNVTMSLGNDDQGFWGMAAMRAAEVNFPNPPKDQPQWLELAQAVFNTQAEPGRHDGTCNGGLRWQIPLANNGYNYKNSISNGCFFNLGARLARYTENQTYLTWAEKTWDWIEGVGLLDGNYNIYDGAHVEKNCTDINKAQFSYNAAVWLLGAAFLWNHTEDARWQGRVEGLLNRTVALFFPDGIAFEIACETKKTCTTDMLSFKGYLHRWLAMAGQLAPFANERIRIALQSSTEAAVAQCTGSDETGTPAGSGRACGFQWSSGVFDGSVGAGQTMNVMSAVSALLMDSAPPPVTNRTGGTSRGNPNAGSNSHDDLGALHRPITTAGRVGAGFVTILVVAGITGLFFTMMYGP